MTLDIFAHCVPTVAYSLHIVASSRAVNSVLFRRGLR
jgi:hypothetical protein